MEYKTIARDNNITEIDIPHGVIDLHKTFDCGQCFRWNELNGGIYSGVVGDDLILVKPIESIENTDRILVSIPQNKIDVFINYLGITDDYSELHNASLSEFEHSVINFGKGIRILHQDIWESIVSFIISQRNNIPKIKTTIGNLCINLGSQKTKKLNNFEKTFYTFPTAEQIIAGGYDKLDKCSLGYRSEYIYLIANEFTKYREVFNSYLNEDKTGAETVGFLEQFKGIGPKVANCIALFGYNKLDMFPIDVWIQRAIEQDFNGYIDINKYGKLAGLMQQYIFYYKRYNKE